MVSNKIIYKIIFLFDKLLIQHFYYALASKINSKIVEYIKILKSNKIKYEIMK